jgi:hypothetical protein
VVEYLLGTIIKKLLKSDVSMWNPFKTSKMRVSIVDALSVCLGKRLKARNRFPMHYSRFPMLKKREKVEAST